MDRIAMSTAAAGLLRALIGRARVPRSRILLTDIRSVDWQSLTFSGERHHLELRVPGPNSGEIVERMCARLEEAEFSIPESSSPTSPSREKPGARSTARPASRSKR